MNYYNDNDPFSAQWLRNLIAAGLLPDGDVDDRPIQEVQGYELEGYRQCHFFAGIGGWPLALRLAGWDADEPVWTGSCPCQPFSVAGKRGGTEDERHLWPELARLIGDRKPPTIFGEQVSGKAGLGWLGGVRTDLALAGYAVGAADLPAASVGAPHKRQRLFWVADSQYPEHRSPQRAKTAQGEERVGRKLLDGGGSSIRDTDSEREFKGALEGLANRQGPDTGGNSADGTKSLPDTERGGRTGEPRGRAGRKPAVCNPGDGAREPGWGNFEVRVFADGKARRIESGLMPLAHGVPGRVGRIRGYGNAIVPQVAAEFIRAFMEVSCMAKPNN